MENIQRVVGISSILIMGLIGSCFAEQQGTAGTTRAEKGMATPVSSQQQDERHMLINKLAGIRGVQVNEGADTITITLDYDTVLYSK